MYRIPSLDPLFPAAVDRTEKTVLLGAALLFLATVVAAVATDHLWLLGVPAVSDISISSFRTRTPR